MAKKHLAFMLAVILIFISFAGCSADSDNIDSTTSIQTSKKTTNDSDFKLSYTQSDSLDPFEAETQNNQVLATLVFESLFDIDESYDPVLNMASGYEYEDSTTLKVDFEPGLKFSDGSSVDCEDVLYSFRAAKKSPAYKNSLKYISSASSDGDNSVIFYLEHANPNAVNLLTFPIASVDDDENGYPVGSGRYSYAEKDGKTVLTANESEDFSPYITTINLVNIAAADSIDNAVNIGNISYAFRDLSSAVSKQMSCAKKIVGMNNLVYIGVNSMSGITADASIRRAISLACDRTLIAESAYNGYASVAASPFNPKASLAENIKIFSDESDTATAKQAITQSGCKESELKLTILANKNNNRQAAAALLKTQLEAVGFTVTIETEKSKEYTRRVKNLEFELYIGEVKLSDDLSLYPFFDDDEGGVRYAINNDELTCDDLYKSYLSGETDLGKFILAFNEEMPFIPLVYKSGMICYTKALNGDMQGYYGNFFSNIEAWYFD